MHIAYVEVHDEKVDRREGVNERGRWQTIRQKAFLHNGDVYPAPFDLLLQEGQFPYKAGKYLFGPGAFRNVKGVWSFSREVALVPIDEIANLLNSRHSAKAA